MTQRAWFTTVGVGLLTSLIPACTPATGMAVRPGRDLQPPASRDVIFAKAPAWPAESTGGEEAQGAPPAPLTPGEDQRLPYRSASLLTSTPDGVTSKPRLGQPADALLGPGPPSLLTSNPSTTAPPAPVANAPPPVQAETTTTPPSRDEPIVLAVRSFLNDKPDEALEYLKHYDASTQEALMCLIATAGRLTKKRLDQLSPAEIVAVDDQLQKGLLSTLRPRAELVIDKACFCEEIKGYGVYKPLSADYAFKPRIGDRPGEWVQLYVEFRNLTSERRGDYYETRLHSAMKIYDHQGKEMITRAFPDNEGAFRTWTPLPNSSKSYSFYVPCMPPGTYTLAFEVDDVTHAATPRVAVKSLEFHVAGPAD
jgi:hypothetical protein